MNYSGTCQIFPDCMSSEKSFQNLTEGPGTVAHAFSPSAREAEADGSL